MTFQIHANPNAHDIMVGFQEGVITLAAILYYDKGVCRVGDEVKPLDWARDIWGEGCPF